MMLKKILIGLCFGLALFGPSLKAQSDWRTWISGNVNYSVNKKFDIGAGVLRSFENGDRFRNSFNQFSLRGNYELTRTSGLAGGVQFLGIPDSRSGTRTRLYIRGYHISRITQELNWTNSIQLETNSRNEPRFRQRIVLGTRLSPRKRLDFLNLSPSVSYRLFYNIGGDPISYYDDQGRRVARQSPDGFHRHRLQLNANSKLNDYLRLNFYLMFQRETNLFSSAKRKMNVPSRNNNRIQRPFDNYNVIGLSLTLDIDELLEEID